MTTRYVVIYESADDVSVKAPIHFPAHRARWQEYRERGELLMIGPFSDLSGAMGVFVSRDGAEEFVRGDPFVLNGVVGSWTIKEWNESLSEH